jgi:hypothetical protein
MKHGALGLSEILCDMTTQTGSAAIRENITEQDSQDVTLWPTSEQQLA